MIYINPYFRKFNNWDEIDDFFDYRKQKRKPKVSTAFKEYMLGSIEPKVSWNSDGTEATAVFDVPGFSKEHISVSFNQENELLVVEAEKDKDLKSSVKKRFTVVLDSIQVKVIKAKCEHGQVTVTAFASPKTKQQILSIPVE